MKDEASLEGALGAMRMAPCPHCRRTGALIGHGSLRGYTERGSEILLRGRRVFCSNRGRRFGCGRTFSLLLATTLAGFVVRTFTLFGFAKTVLDGFSPRAAWLHVCDGAFSLSSAYRLWRRLATAQSALRTQLSRELPAPPSTARHPLAQLLGHLAALLGADGPDPFAAFQDRLQRGLFAQ